jgi:hypothetical protein
MQYVTYPNTVEGEELSQVGVGVNSAFLPLTTPTYDFALLLPVAMVAAVLVILDGFLFDVTAIAKLHVVGILLFWTDGQEGVEFLELPGDPRAGLLFISHIEVSNRVAVGA